MVRRNECYTLHLFSTNGDGANNNEKTYTVEWSSFLPKDFKRYKVMIIFSTASENFDIPSGFAVRATIPCSSTLSNISGKRRSVVFGIAYQDLKKANHYLYHITKDSSAEVTIEYPTENRFTIELVDVSSTTGALLSAIPDPPDPDIPVPAYQCFLLFYPIA